MPRSKLSLALTQIRIEREQRMPLRGEFTRWKLHAEGRRAVQGDGLNPEQRLLAAFRAGVRAGRKHPDDNSLDELYIFKARKPWR